MEKKTIKIMCDCFFHTVPLGDCAGLVRSLPVEVMFELSPATTRGRVRDSHFFWAVVLRRQQPEQWVLMSKHRQGDFRARILPSQRRVVAAAADAILGSKHGLTSPDLRSVCAGALVRSGCGDALVPFSSVTLRDCGSLAPSPLLQGQSFRCAGPGRLSERASTPSSTPERDRKRARQGAHAVEVVTCAPSAAEEPPSNEEERIRAVCEEFPTWNADVVLSLLRWGATPELSAVNRTKKMEGRTWCDCTFRQPSGLLVSDIVLPLSALLRAYPATVQRLTSRTAAC